MTVTRQISLLFIILFSSQSLLAQDDDFVFYSDLARDWYQGGGYFEWTSTTEDNNDAKVNVFYKNGVLSYTQNPYVTFVILPIAVCTFRYTFSA